MTEKVDATVVHDEMTEKYATEAKVITGDEAYTEAMMKEPPQPWTRAQMLVYLFSVVAFFNSTITGYDGSLINNLLQNPWFLKAYDGTNSGVWAGIVSSIFQIGGIAALPFVGPVLDQAGRRAGMFSGALIIIIGTIIQGTSHSVGQFMGGRFLIGFGGAIAASAAPTYVVEINHPAYRGVIGGMYMTLFFSGSILASGAARGAINVGGDYSWRLITWLQILFPGLVVIFSFLIPESPRWLYVHNKKDEAKKILTKYHGNGDENSIWVTLQLREYEEFLEMDGADKRWWDYRVLVKKGNAYRIGCALLVAILAQFAGNAVLSYFLASVLDAAGYRSYLSQANITLINNCQQFLFAILGTFLVDRFGRRKLLMFAYSACAVIWLGMTVASSKFAESYAGVDANGSPIYTNDAASKAAIAFVFLFGAAFSIGITPIQMLYPAEVLSFEMRAKGMAMMNLGVNVALLINQYGFSVAMQRIGWHTYIIFTVWNVITVAIIFFAIPETRGRTLEEIDRMFATNNPVKASLARKQVLVTDTGAIIGVDSA